MASRVLSTGIPFSILPENYVRPESERPKLSEVTDCENEPIIDLGCADRNRVIPGIGDACPTFGFFQEINHGISVESTERMFEFSHLPLEGRMKMKMKMKMKMGERQTQQVAVNLEKLKQRSSEQEEEEARFGVSTELKLSEDTWFRKKLKKSDVGHLSRLLLPTKKVRTHILPFLDANQVRLIETAEGARVTIHDLDTGTDHRMTFKKLVKSTKSYIFINNWMKKFVVQRGLKEGDKIGMFWHRYFSKFYFRVLQRAPRNNPPMI